jgi:hypothetical protein
MQPRHRFASCLALISLAVFGLLPSRSSAGSIATSDFSVNDEGWRISGDATSAVPSYVPTGGNPGGFIQVFDQVLGDVWFWEAPAKFLGNVSGAYGQPLTFDLRMRGSGPLFSDSDIILAGGSLTLHFETSPVPTDVAWTSYSVLMMEAAGWKVGSLAGPAPTQAQFLSVISSLDRLGIRGEFITGPDNGDLDNVVLHGVPEPRSLLLFGTGTLVMSCFGRHCKPRRARTVTRWPAKPGAAAEPARRGARSSDTAFSNTRSPSRRHKP